MTEPFPKTQPGDPMERDLAADLAQGDGFIAAASPILRHLLANDDHALFSDEVIARIRGMISFCARQMLLAVAAAGGTEDRAAFMAVHEAGLTGQLLGDTAYLGHAHALVLEAQLAERLQQRSAIDPALSPLLQELAASPDAATAALAMHVLAAQARFVQQQRRMEWPLAELPGDLLHKAMLVLQAQDFAPGDVLETAVQGIRREFDENRRRVAQITRLIMTLERKAARALALDHAGLAIFVTALGMASQQSRELAMMALCENQFARLALSLRAAGLSQEDVVRQFLFLHPEITLPPGFERLLPDRAAAMLASSDQLATA